MAYTVNLPAFIPLTLEPNVQTRAYPTIKIEVPYGHGKLVLGWPVIGGIVATALTNKIAGKLVEEDRVKILKVIEAQLEHLALTFMLTKDELDKAS